MLGKEGFSEWKSPYKRGISHPSLSRLTSYLEDVLKTDVGSLVGTVVKGPKCKNDFKGKNCDGESYEVLQKMAYPIVNVECVRCKNNDYIIPIKE